MKYILYSFVILALIISQQNIKTQEISWENFDILSNNSDLQNNLIKTITNNMFEVATQEVNDQVPIYLQENGFDPLEKGIDGKGSEKIDSQFCKGDINYGYQINNIRGLSSVQIGDITVTEIKEINENNELTVLGHLTIKFDKNIDFDFDGKAQAQCSGIKLNQNFDGLGSIIELTGESDITIIANVDNYFDPIIEEVIIDDLVIDYKKIQLHIENAGPFQHMVQELVINAEEHVREDMKKTLSSLFKVSLQEMINVILVS